MIDKVIDKVGAIIVNNGKMLAVREKDSIWFFIPGGKREGEENDEECLKRELSEELGTDSETLDFYKEFVAQATSDKDMVKVRAYFCNILKIMVPQLKEEGYIS